MANFRKHCKLRRKIYEVDDFERFKLSDCFKEVLKFIEEIADSVIGKTLREEVTCNDAVNGLYKMLGKFDSLISEYPAIEQKESRFGNKAFRDWHSRIATESRTLLSEFVPKDNVREVRGYLITSFGHPGRIDYGTGHELNFILVLLCLSKLGLLCKEDYPAVVLKVFWRYVMLTRGLFVEYWLEPAGSQGVWGLDDYCFLPFLFGAAQLCDHKYLRPKSILNEEFLDEFEEDYMYFSGIKFINSVKTVPFELCAPLLNDISSAKSWMKVYTGMVKLYKDQVLQKLPVIQHLKFGSIINYDPESASDLKSEDSLSSDGSYGDIEHTHSLSNNISQGLPECCGVRVPSSVAASASQGKNRNLSKKRLNFIPSD